VSNQGARYEVPLAVHFSLLPSFRDDGVCAIGAVCGTWEIRRSPTTGKGNLTVTIIKAEDTTGGTVTFLDPDGTTLHMPIAKTEINGDALDFQTLAKDASWHCSLTLSNARSGILRGDRGHMGIQEKVKKKR
jgi:hypothetical protein